MMNVRLFLLLLFPVFCSAQNVRPGFVGEGWTMREYDLKSTLVGNDSLGLSLCFPVKYFYPVPTVPEKKDLHALRRNASPDRVLLAGHACWVVYRKRIRPDKFRYGIKWSDVPGAGRVVMQQKKHGGAVQYPLRKVFHAGGAVYNEITFPWKDGYLSVLYRLDAGVCGFDPLDVNFRVLLSSELDMLEKYTRKSVRLLVPGLIEPNRDDL